MNLEGTITSLGIPTIIAALVYIGKKLQVLEDLRATTDKMKLNLKVISDYLAGSRADFNHKELQDYSPLKLNNEGKRLIERLGFDAVFSRHRDDFFTYIDGEAPKLKYDVETAAIRSISVLYNRNYMEFLKVFLYNNPNRSLQNVAPTLGIYVRDKYLLKHPSISE